MTGRVVAVAYVGAVTTLASVGFTHDSTVLILIAAAVTLPLGIPAMLGYYAMYGLLALVPGANPSEASGSTTCTADGVCTSTGTGDLAGWFALTTDVLGVVVLAGAAVGNALLWRRLVHRRPRRLATAVRDRRSPGSGA